MNSPVLRLPLLAPRLPATTELLRILGKCPRASVLEGGFGQLDRTPTTVIMQGDRGSGRVAAVKQAARLLGMHWVTAMATEVKVIADCKEIASTNGNDQMLSDNLRHFFKYWH